MVDKLERKWLPHLKDSITNSASITGVSLYTIALEGWRRGLKLEFYTELTAGEKKRIKYSLEDGENKFYFNDSSGDLNTDEAIKICGDKGLTQKYLETNNVPTPLGKEFDAEDSIEKMLKYSRTLTYPLVVKPVDGFGGSGVIVNIKDEKELKDAIDYVTNKLSFKRIIIQEYVKGNEVRIYVLNNKVIAAANRVPAHIVGDGKSTIASLIQEKNYERRKNPNLRHRLIRLDSALNQYLESLGLTLDTVLNKNKLLTLREISNVSLGGEPVDYTELLTDEQKAIAEKATKSIPGLAQCGVDMMIDTESNRSVIIELNASPGIGTHLFPVKGKSRDIPKHVIDFYFPKSQKYDKSKQLFYFDLERIIDPLLTGALSKVEVPNYPEDSFFTKRFIIEIKANKYNEKLPSLIYQEAKKLKLNGYINKEKDDNKVYLEIVVNHRSERNVERVYQLLEKFYKEGIITKIQKKEYKKPLKIGFDYTESENSMMELELNHRQVYREYRAIKTEVNRVKKRLTMLKKSNFWKAVTPIRKIESLLKRKNIVR